MKQIFKHVKATLGIKWRIKIKEKIKNKADNEMGTQEKSVNWNRDKVIVVMIMVIMVGITAIIIMIDILKKKELRKWWKRKVIEIWIIMGKTEIKSIESNHKFIDQQSACNANTWRTHKWF